MPGNTAGCWGCNGLVPGVRTDPALPPDHPLPIRGKAGAGSGQLAPQDGFLAGSPTQGFQQVLTLGFAGRRQCRSLHTDLQFQPLCWQYTVARLESFQRVSCGMGRISTPRTPRSAVTLYTPGVPTWMKGKRACDCQPSGLCQGQQALRIS